MLLSFHLIISSIESAMNIAHTSATSAAGYQSVSGFRNATVRLRSYQNLVTPSLAERQPNRAYQLLQVHQLRESLLAIKPGRVRNTSSTIAAQQASAVSNFQIDFSTGANTQLRSVEEINTAPTSFQHNGPDWTGSTATAPWSGPGSTAAATVGGSYDGSDGEGILKFEVNRAGTHGVDDLRIKVFADDGTFIQNINIDQNDPTNQVYELNNGLTLSLGAGDLVKNDYFEIDTSILSTSYTPNAPGWTGSTANASIGGLYDGSEGSGDLKFLVARQGVHGEDDLRIKVYAPDDSFIENINIGKNDAIDKVYTLSNGLTFSLGEGELIKNETFAVTVDATDPGNYTSAPDWIFSTAVASLTGTYDGSNGTGTLSFRALDTGVHGEDDLRVRVYAPDGSTMETISIDKDDPVDSSYELSNGLSVTFSAGSLIRNEIFTVDVESTTSFSTTPNAVASTAAAAIRGIYDGSLGTDVLEFTVTQAGTHGVDDLALDVRTSDGTFLETLNIAATDSLDQVYALSNGLNFSLGAGSLALDETFSVGINHLVPTSVDPNLSFDGTGTNDAKLEDQFSVADGSFEVNGNTIAVFANDSINSVLNRINNAGIDVTAIFDATSETILMTHDLAGSENDIVLSNDTSGFLAATKLAGANSIQETGDETTTLSELTIMSSVTSGSININGTSIAIDVDVDSLDDVLSRIDAMVDNVDTEFDSETGKVAIFGMNQTDLNLVDGGTGFFAAVEIDEGSHVHVDEKNITQRGSGFSYQGRRDTARAINDFARRFNALFEDKYGTKADPYLQKIRDDLKTAITGVVASENANERSSLGIEFDFDPSSDGPVQFSDQLQREFKKNLKSASGADKFNALFFDNLNHDGIVDRMLNVVEAVEKEMRWEPSPSGSLLNVWA